jgi:L,D-transpeptidase YcbB
MRTGARKTSGGRLAVVLAVLAGPATPARQVGPTPPIAAALSEAPPAAAHSAFEGLLPALDRFYAKRQYQPVWTTGPSLSPAAASALRALGEAREEGLNVEDYLAAPIGALAAARDPSRAAELEVLVSLAVGRYTRDLGWGISLPSEVDKDHSYPARTFVADEVLDAVVRAPDAGAAIRAYRPATFVYNQFAQALADLRAIQARGGWKTVAAGPVLRAGDAGARVLELRARLVERGDLPLSASTGDSFDVELAAALKRFQERHGLTPDGVYGKAVVSQFNVPLATRITQIRLAMERLRWLPDYSTVRRVAVNLADFRTYVFDGNSIAFETRSVIGKRFHETPMFTAMMTYLVINPYWNVPPSIARNEILPKVKSDPDYLASHHMEMNGSSIRQLPGPWNSLGRFKFMFPNSHNVYLHDTPARALFAQADRAFSHGCVRLEQPAELAALLLADQGWTPERIEAAVAAGKPVVVTLEKPVPVTIGYATAFRTPDGLLHYRRDVYGRDARLLAALEQRSSGSWER